MSYYTRSWKFDGVQAAFVMRGGQRRGKTGKAEKAEKAEKTHPSLPHIFSENEIQILFFHNHSLFSFSVKHTLSFIVNINH